MKIANVLKASLVAVVLVSSTAMPAAAHGDIRRQEVFLDSPGGSPVGYLIRYCDGHLELIGEMSIWSETEFFVCPA